MSITTREIAQAASIGPRTKHFRLTDEYGLAYDGGRTYHVLAALGRSDKTPALDQRTRIVAAGMFKCFTTGRMNVHLARYLREDLTPYQLCGIVAKIANSYQGWPSIGDLADTWINQHAAGLAGAAYRD